MRYTLTEQFLFLLADLTDFNQRCFSWRLVLAMPGDPRLRRHKRWLEKHLKDKRKRKKLYNVFQSLKRREFLQEKILGNSRGYLLTPKGRLKIFRLKTKKIKRKKLPQGNWLIVFFDIPEKRRKTRDLFRLTLKELGFERLQRSVWVTPYQVSRELKELIKDCDLEKYAKSLLVKELER